MRLSHALIVITCILLALVSCGDKSTSNEDTNPPRVRYVYPADSAVDVRRPDYLWVVFSESIDTNTLTTSSFYLVPAVDGWILPSLPDHWDATLQLNEDLEEGATYQAIIKGSIADMAGNRMGEDYVWSFTTLPDTVRPRISSISPDSNTAATLFMEISITFSEDIDTSLVTPATFYLTPPASGFISFPWGRRTAKFSYYYLDCNTDYMVTIDDAITDLAGNHLESDITWSYTAYVDTVKPEVGLVVPEDSSSGVPTRPVLHVRFTDAIDSNSVSLQTVDIDPSVDGFFDYFWNGFYFVPSDTLLSYTEYTVTLSSTISDICGNELGEDYIWSFTTK
ncbi:MAG: Ig-like domain-containing protein [bacterium]